MIGHCNVRFDENMNYVPATKRSDESIDGIVAARPNEPPLEMLRGWLQTLEKSVGSEQRAVIVSLLKDAVPEFKATAE